MENSENNTNTIDLQRLIVLFRRHIVMLLLWTFLTGVFGLVVAKFVVVPKYTANVELLVNQRASEKDNGQAYNDQQADVQYINTYKDIITNQVILNKVSHDLNSSKTARQYGRTYTMSTGDLKQSIKISNQQNSQVFSVAVKTDDPQKSAAAANSIARVFKKQIKKIMAVNNVTIVSRASVPGAPSFPNVKLFSLAGAILGLLGSSIYLIIKDLMDTAVNNDDFMVKELGLTNLGHVNHFHMNHKFRANRGQNVNNQAMRRV